MLTASINQSLKFFATMPAINSEKNIFINFYSFHDAFIMHLYHIF